MNSQTTLIKISNFDFKLNHFIIIGVLILAFSTSFAIRSQPLQYGNELNEFDPFFNFRATEYIVENGFMEYFEWYDDKSWYPSGRDISSTSQSMLHFTTAITYQIFGNNLSLYDYAILFPAIIGSLTVIAIFSLVRLIGGTTAGLIASMLFAISLPILIRGSVGWLKSEPLGLFYGVIGLYLFLSGIKSENKKISVLKIIFSGIVMAFGIASWGGNQFFIIPIGLFIMALPFVRKDHKFLIWSIPLFVGIFLSVTSLFERPGPTFVYGLGGISLIITTVFLMSCIFIQKISSTKNKSRNGLLLLFIIIIIGSFLVAVGGESGLIGMPSFRYFNAINPFLTNTDTLADSISEHASTSINLSFLFHSVWMIFAGLGVWMILSKKLPQNKIFLENDLKIFVLILGITGVYFSSVFIRLEIFASLGLIVLTSISLSILSKEIFKVKFNGRKNYLIKSSYIILILFLFSLPLSFPQNSNWINNLDTPASILTGATANTPTNDWLETLEWIKLNTPENSIIAAWWDYGYWITSLSDRTTLVDNATLSTEGISRMAKILMSSPDDSWKILEKMNVDYVLVFFAAEDIDNRSQEFPLYVIGNGGDESKIYWFSKIAGFTPGNYLHSDAKTPTRNFYENTLLGQMMPFTPVVYYQPQTQENSQVFKDGFIEISRKNIKYDSDEDPLKLVYSSPSFTNDDDGKLIFVLIYEVNKNYAP